MYDAFVPLGLCPLVLTGMDTALIFEAASAGVRRAIASHQARS